MNAGHATSRLTRALTTIFLLTMVIGGAAETYARMFDPHLGRWTRRDPLGYVDGMSLYQFANSRPVTHFDPLGLRVLQEDDPEIPGLPGDFTDKAPSNCDFRWKGNEDIGGTDCAKRIPGFTKAYDDALQACESTPEFPGGFPIRIACSNQCPPGGTCGVTTVADGPPPYIMIMMCLGNCNIVNHKDEFCRKLLHELVHAQQYCQFFKDLGTYDRNAWEDWSSQPLQCLRNELQAYHREGLCQGTSGNERADCLCTAACASCREQWPNQDDCISECKKRYFPVVDGDVGEETHGAGTSCIRLGGGRCPGKT